ncbi:hypothetical protein HYALB_00006681 [Hymenoscyphus albidus]|uniref:Glucose-methanol-choline oxidoreductase N-terminal domain-containing protein n=1 Tax=Hymenoscyphus albidus TaxID=595503 RepID=A0A9N9LJK0_9HELO|nr:hypothetical protein HYALB_00006681 [Hymenoscyphus albidus]
MLSRLVFGGLVALVAAANESYEYIVVGSGPGGGPVAANLARAGHSVLLLEAGDDQTQNVNVSQLMNFNIAANDEKTRWDFFVNHTDNDLGYNHMVYRKPDGGFYTGLQPPKGATRLGIWYPRTGTLGGCAMHNGAVVSLPGDADWNYISEITGDKGWLTQNMRPHFKAMERNADISSADTSHGFNGWLDISLGDTTWADTDADAVSPAKKAANMTGGDPNQLKALMGRDIDAKDPNRDQTLGVFGSWSHATKQGQRSSPGYYVKETVNDPAKYPLTLQLNSLVSKVIFDKTGKTPRAVGVEYLRGEFLYGGDPRNVDGKRKGKPGKAFASKEVIIAGGAFNSPQILMLSGIGPAEELKKFNIPVIVDSSGVGRNLDDNYEGSVASLAARDFQGASNIFFNFLKTSQSTGSRDIQMWCGQFSFEGFWPGFPDDFGPKQYECTFVHMNPRSQKGFVKLRSANPQDTPEINFKFWEKNSDKDLQAMLEAIKFGRKIVQDAKTGLGPFTEIHPCTSDNCSDEETLAFLKKQVYSHHATSTCAIGGDNDKMSVLDSKFRVRGVKGLRVVDASAFPKVPGAFPVIPTIVLSEKATDDILSELKEK